MTTVACTQPLLVAETVSTAEPELGAIETENNTYIVSDLTHSEELPEPAARMLQEAGEPKPPTTELCEFKFTHITQELIETEIEIENLLQELDLPKNAKESKTPLAEQQSRTTQTPKPDTRSQEKQLPREQAKNNTPLPSSIFALARSFNSSHAEKQSAKQEQNHKQLLKENSTTQTAQTAARAEEKEIQPSLVQQDPYDREGDRERGKEKDDRHQEEQEENQDLQKKKKPTFSIGNVQAARSDPFQSPFANSGQMEPSNNNPAPRSNEAIPSIDNIYIRFMNLMARILGQAEYEGHQLYLRIKERTDDVDTLTLLLSKINLEKKGIDWSKNEEMKQLIEKARAIGVEIAPGQVKWSEEEKKLLKENIQMRKDSMEKITQLERTDMQRYLQEASQCHQARSNILKLLKEVTDTIIHNMRPS